jgi:hypothetical protein
LNTGNTHTSGIFFGRGVDVASEGTDVVIAGPKSVGVGPLTESSLNRFPGFTWQLIMLRAPKSPRTNLLAVLHIRVMIFYIFYK